MCLIVVFSACEAANVVWFFAVLIAASTTSQWDLKFGEGQTFAKAFLTSDRLKTFSCISVQEKVWLPCARSTHFWVLCAATWQMNPVEVHCRTQRLNFLFFLFRSSLSVQVVMNTGSSSIKGSWRTWKHKGDSCTHEFVLVDFYITMSQVQDVLLKKIAGLNNGGKKRIFEWGIEVRLRMMWHYS